MSIVQNPDGQIAYLEKYKSETTQPEVEEVPVQVIVDITQETYEIAEELQKYAKFIKIICIVDIFITAVNIGSQYPYGIGICLISLCGYQRAVQYNEKFLTVYSIYQTFKIIFKIVLLFYISSVYFVILMLSIMFDAFVLYQCKQFIKLLP